MGSLFLEKEKKGERKRRKMVKSKTELRANGSFISFPLSHRILLTLNEVKVLDSQAFRQG